MPVTIPGVKSLIVDGFFAAGDDSALNARRILVVAPANPQTTDETPGYLENPASNELYNPTLYKNENDVIADFGLGSPAHVAFVQCVRAGGSNVYVSATAPHSVADAKAEPSGDYAAYTKREYEVVQALESVDLVLPEVIVLAGYSVNEYTVKTGSARAPKYGEIVAKTCASLLADSYPCLGVIAPVDIETHLDLNRADPAGTPVARIATAYNKDRLTAGNVNEYVNDLASSVLAVDGATITDDWFVGVPLPLSFVLSGLESQSAADGPKLSRFLVVPVGEVVCQTQPDTLTGQDGDGHNTYAPKFTTAAAAVAGHIFNTPYNGSVTLARMNNIRFIHYRFSRSNLLALIGVKAMPVNVDSSQFVITVDGLTAAQDNTSGETSHYTRLQTLTICHELVRGSRAVAERYIGKTADENTLNSLETQLRSYYLDKKQEGAVRDIRFNVEYYYTQQKLNINITVVPAGEIREIQLNVGISLQ